MRILDLSGIYPNEIRDYEGGFVASLDAALAERGNSVMVIVLRQWAPRWVARRMDRYRHLAVRDRVFKENGVNIVFTHFAAMPSAGGDLAFRLNVLSMTRKVLAAHRRYGSQVDVVHAQGLSMGIAAAHVAARLGVPFYVTLTDDLGHFMRSSARTHPFYKRVFSEASAIFTIGPGLVRDLASMGREASLPQTVPTRLGIDLSRLNALVASFGNRRRAATQTIASVSSFVRWKGVHENLYAMKRLLERGVQGWRYTVVGDGPYRRELEDLTRHLGLSDLVSFVGNQPHPDAVRAIWNSDVFCLPSYMEAFGIVFAEAAACGVPAIGCLGNGPEAIIRHGETGLLVPPRDVEALADALAFLLSDRHRATQMGHAALEHIQQFSWKSVAATYAKTFDECGHGGS